MRSKFPGYYKPTSEEFDKLWKEALIVLDANVLLDFYRYSDDTVNALLDTVTLLRERIFIPYRVSLEYHRNLNEVITTQVNSYKKTIDTLEDFKKQLEAKRSHPFLAKNLHDEIQEFCEKFDAELNKKKVDVENLITDNPIKDKLGELLDDRVGDCFDDKEIEKICIEGASRFSEKVPPGYMDSKGKKGNDVYGDLIVWKEIIKRSRVEDRDVIIITGDVKEDWFTKNMGRTIGPRPELIHEFKFETNRLLYIYPTNQFLEFANQYLKTNINKDVLDEVEKILEESIVKNVDDFGDLSCDTQVGNNSGSTVSMKGELDSVGMPTQQVDSVGK